MGRGEEIYLNEFLNSELEGEWLDSRSGCFIYRKDPSLSTKEAAICDSGLSEKGREINILLYLPETKCSWIAAHLKLVTLLHFNFSR